MWPEIIPTIIICALLAGAVALAIISIVKDKKKGKGCGCGCSSCAMKGACAMNSACHAAKNNTENKNPPDASAKASEDKCEN